VWLIEVNTNPCLEESSSTLKMLLPRMIDDMLKLTVDKIFKRKNAQAEKIFKVDGYDNNTNMWELICKLN